MKIKSPAFENGERMPERYTADGENVNPELEISELPNGTKSVVLIVDDPDAKRVVGYTWVHWVRFNIPVSGDLLKIDEDSIPGVSGESTYKKAEYGGPNPPAGTGVHNYNFKVYAISKILDLPKMVPLDVLEKEIDEKSLARAELIGRYWRRDLE